MGEIKVDDPADDNPIDIFADSTQMIPPAVEETSTHRGARPKTKTTSQSYDNPSYQVDEPPTKAEEKRLATLATLARREKNQDGAWGEIIAKFPDFKPETSKFIAWVDEFGTVKVRLIRKDRGNIIF